MRSGSDKPHPTAVCTHPPPLTVVVAQSPRTRVSQWAIRPCAAAPRRRTSWTPAGGNAGLTVRLQSPRAPGPPSPPHPTPPPPPPPPPPPHNEVYCYVVAHALQIKEGDNYLLSASAPSCMKPSYGGPKFHGGGTRRDKLVACLGPRSRSPARTALAAHVQDAQAWATHRLSACRKSRRPSRG